MTFKKIDWLRHLYHEVTKWKHSLAGQVKWRKLDDKDPNNGSKLTVNHLETCLPGILENCLNQDQIPFEYKPEVNKFLAYIKKQEKDDCKAISKLVQSRKQSICLFEIFEKCLNLTAIEKVSIIEKFDIVDLKCLYSVVQKLKIRLEGVGSSGDAIISPTDDKTRPFKLIDWLRHMYLMCQKWLTQKDGQLQWKNIDARDPNNSKDGSRMKLDELKESLKILAPRCLELKVVPKRYFVELLEAQKVLGSHGLDFDTIYLKVEENLRKISTVIMDTLLHPEDMFEEVLTTIRPSKLPRILEGASALETMIGDYFVQENEETGDREGEGGVDDAGEIEGDCEETDEASNMAGKELLQDTTDFDGEVDIVDDGTSALMKLIEEASHNEIGPPNPVPSDFEDLLASVHVNTFMNGVEHEPVSPSSGSEILSEVSSPASPDHKPLDSHLSDDSGIYSDDEMFNDSDKDHFSTTIEHYSLLSNPLDLEHPEALKDFESDYEMFSDIDFSELPDVTLPCSEVDLFSTTIEHQDRKRKLSDDCYEQPRFKKARP